MRLLCHFLLFVSVGLGVSQGAVEWTLVILGRDRADPAHAAFVAGVAEALLRADEALDRRVALRDATGREMAAGAQAAALAEIISGGCEGLILLPHPALDWGPLAEISGGGCEGLILLPHPALDWGPLVEVLALEGGRAVVLGEELAGEEASFLPLPLVDVEEGVLEGACIVPSPYYSLPAEWVGAAEGARRVARARTAIGFHPPWMVELRGSGVERVLQPDVYGMGFRAAVAVGRGRNEPLFETLFPPDLPVVFTSAEVEIFEDLWRRWLD